MKFTEAQIGKIFINSEGNVLKLVNIEQCPTLTFRDWDGNEIEMVGDEQELLEMAPVQPKRKYERKALEKQAQELAGSGYQTGDDNGEPTDAQLKELGLVHTDPPTVAKDATVQSESIFLSSPNAHGRPVVKETVTTDPFDAEFGPDRTERSAIPTPEEVAEIIGLIKDKPAFRKHIREAYKLSLRSDEQISWGISKLNPYERADVKKWAEEWKEVDG